MSKNAMRADLSRQMKKNNKSTRTHPAFRQSWDTLLVDCRNFFCEQLFQIWPR
jgi:hypothetical protein